MSQNPYEQPPMMTPVAPPAPPTMAGPVGAPPGEESWPKVIGVICIVFGAMGMMGGGCGALGPLFSSLVPQPQQVSPNTTLTIIQVAESVVLLLTAVLLLVGGIGLLKRRRWGLQALLAWAILKLVYAVAVGVIGIITGPQQIAQLESNPQTAQFAKMIGSMVPVCVIGSTLWTMALPIFILIWFSRRKIKDQVSRWE